MRRAVPARESWLANCGSRPSSSMKEDFVSCGGAAAGEGWLWVGNVVSAVSAKAAWDGGAVIGLGLEDLTADETVLGYCRLAIPAALDATLELLLPIAGRVWSCLEVMFESWTEVNHNVVMALMSSFRKIKWSHRMTSSDVRSRGVSSLFQARLQGPHRRLAVAGSWYYSSVKYGAFRGEIEGQYIHIRFTIHSRLCFISYYTHRALTCAFALTSSSTTYLYTDQIATCPSHSYVLSPEKPSTARVVYCKPPILLLLYSKPQYRSPWIARTSHSLFPPPQACLSLPSTSQTTS
jgi:hypothetical protein